MEVKTDLVCTALIKARSEFKEFKKNKVAKVGAYQYEYADLGTILHAVTPALTNNQLTLSQTVFQNQTGENFLATYLYHSSGQSLVNQVPLFETKGNGPQAQGSSLTYARRYGIAALLSLSADEDDDAASAQSTAPPPPQQPKPKVVDYTQTAIKPMPATQSVRNGPSEPQLKRLFALTKAAGRGIAEVDDVIRGAWNISRQNLSKNNYDEVCNWLQGLGEMPQPQSNREAPPPIGFDDEIPF